MKKNKFLLRGLLVASIFAFGTGAAHADLLKDIRDAKKIRIALDTGSPPYGFVGSDMQPTGSDVETARLLAKDLGVELEIIQVTSPNRIPFLQSGKADIVVASLSVTPEREKVIDFSVPYAQILAVVAAPKDAKIANFADLKGMRVATTRGSNNDKVVTTGAPDAKIVRYDDDATLVTALVSGQADTIATSPAILTAIKAKVPTKDLTTKFVMQTVPLGIGMRKDEPQLKAWLNDWITKNQSKLSELHKKFHGN